MANQEHLVLIRKRKDNWNDWRFRNPDIVPDLSNANLSNADLYGRNLSNVNLFKADLFDADLANANLFKATLSWANLRNSNLRYANLNFSSLENADLYNSNLYRATLNSSKLSKANLIGADLTEADLTAADLTEAKLALSRLVGTNLKDANLTSCCVYGVSTWNINLENAIQLNLIVNPLNEPLITVDNLEVAQFIYLLINNSKIRDVINTLTSKMVLILGRFTAGRKLILDALREELRKHNFLPVLFDFENSINRDTHETVTTLAGLSQFVLADITDPKSIPQELVSIVESMPSLAVQPLIQAGFEPWGMYDHIKRYPWVLKLKEYESLEHLLFILPNGLISSILAKSHELRKNND
jgi:hypothetical protein